MIITGIIMTVGDGVAYASMMKSVKQAKLAVRDLI